MQTRAKFAAPGRRWSRLKVISRGKNPRPTASGSHSRARQLAITFGLARQTWRSLHSLTFDSLRVMYYFFLFLLHSLAFPYFLNAQQITKAAFSMSVSGKISFFSVQGVYASNPLIHFRRIPVLEHIRCWAFKKLPIDIETYWIPKYVREVEQVSTNKYSTSRDSIAVSPSRTYAYRRSSI